MQGPRFRRFGGIAEGTLISLMGNCNRLRGRPVGEATDPNATVEDSGSALMPAGACEAGVRTAPLRAVDIVGSPVEVSPAHEASAETQTVEGNDVVRQLSGGTSNFLLGS